MIDFHKYQQLCPKSLPVDFAAIIKLSGQSQERKRISHQQLGGSDQLFGLATPI
jgi:hypothetical protein